MVGERKNRLLGIFLLSLLFLIVFPFCSASDNIQTLGKIKSGDSILLKQNCVNATYVNITSISVVGLIQTKELLLAPISMNLISNGYQTYNFSNTSIAGQYIVTGICNENGIAKAWSYDFNSGSLFGTETILVYILFLFVCLMLVYFSARLIKTNSEIKDNINNHQLYELKKKHEFSFYLKVFKRKLWVIGLFGIYLSVLLFIALLNQLSYSLGLTDLNNILNNTFIVLAWGLIPFVIFWMCYIIIYLYKSTEEILKYQLGGFKN